MVTIGTDDRSEERGVQAVALEVHTHSRRATNLQVLNVLQQLPNDDVRVFTAMCGRCFAASTVWGVGPTLAAAVSAARSNACFQKRCHATKQTPF
jgi:hypothetical protein